jgi:SAM-dependent methyltransferase
VCAKVPVGFSMQRTKSPDKLRTMDADAYYSGIQSAYDRVAAEYDETIGRALVSRRAKERAVEEIARVSPPGGSLLDVGCYTGTEALLLARRGFRVVGVDLSPRMIELSRNKARRSRLADRTQFEIARASDLSGLQAAGLDSFDTAYSVYGTLNLEPRVESFRTSVASLLKPHGALVVGLLNPIVLYELVFCPLALRFDGYRKLASLNVPYRIGSGEVSVPSFLYSPAEFERLLRPEFSLDRVLGVHILYPPPRSGRTRGEGLWFAARALDRLEDRLDAHRPFSSLGRFSLMVFHKSS